MAGHTVFYHYSVVWADIWSSRRRWPPSSPPLRGRRACYRVQIPRMMRLWFIVRADKGNAWTWRVCEGVCIGRGEGRGGKRLTRMSTDLFLLPAKASWESKRSNRHRTSIYETRLRNEISSGEEGEILFFFFFFLLRILLIILSIYFSWKRILNYNTYMFTWI